MVTCNFSLSFALFSIIPNTIRIENDIIESNLPKMLAPMEGDIGSSRLTTYISDVFWMLLTKGTQN